MVTRASSAPTGAAATPATDPGPTPAFTVRSPEPHSWRAGAFDALADAAAIVDRTGRITDVNTTWLTFAALNHGDPATTGIGADYLEACDRAAAMRDADAAIAAEGLRGVLSGRLESFEHRYPCPSDLEDRWFVLRVTPLADSRGVLVCHLDVTAAKLNEDRLAHQASHDTLTGLPNREAVLTFVKAAFSRLDRTGVAFAVLFLDLDGFKPVNDHFGHATGDRFLVKVANRLQHQLRASDQLGRVGGDEFVALCNAADADGLARRLAAAVSEPMQAGERTVQVTVSIGIAIGDTPPGPDAHAAARALLALADDAMYAAKRVRRNAR